jgi:hypothetical protein
MVLNISISDAREQSPVSVDIGAKATMTMVSMRFGAEGGRERKTKQT